MQPDMPFSRKRKIRYQNTPLRLFLAKARSRLRLLCEHRILRWIFVALLGLGIYGIIFIVFSNLLARPYVDISYSQKEFWLQFLWLPPFLVACALLASKVRQPAFRWVILYSTIVYFVCTIVFYFYSYFAMVSKIFGLRKSPNYDPVYMSLEVPDSNHFIWYFSIVLVTGSIALLWVFPKKILAQSKRNLEIKDYLGLENSLRTTLLQVVGGVIVLVGFYFAWQNANIANENLNLTLKQRVTERFDKALLMIKDENPEQRMMGFSILNRVSLESSDYTDDVVKLYTEYLKKWSGSRTRGTDGHVSDRVPEDINFLLSGLGKITITPKIAKQNAPRRLSFRTAASPNIADLVNLDFTNIELRWTIQTINFDSTRFQNGRMNDSRFESCTMRNADFRSISCLGCEWNFSALADAIYDRAQLDHVTFSKSDLQGASFRGASLREAIFIDCEMARVDFSGADLLGADLSKATGLSVFQIKNARNAGKAKLPAGMANELRESGE
jgi:uncharacterized protein YjbI with pentapeptide repeats